MIIGQLLLHKTKSTKNPLLRAAKIISCKEISCFYALQHECPCPLIGKPVANRKNIENSLLFQPKVIISRTFRDCNRKV
jgi:hypothetical protein